MKSPTLAAVAVAAVVAIGGCAEHRTQAEDPLVTAIQHYNVERVRQLLAESPGAADRPLVRPGFVLPCYPLTLAIESPIAQTHTSMVRLLLQKGARVNAWYDGGTPLCQAIQRGEYDTVALLLEFGADPNLPSPGPFPSPPFMSGFFWDLYPRPPVGIVALAPEQFAEIPISRPLHAAAVTAQLAIIELLLARGADPNATQDVVFYAQERAGGTDTPQTAHLVVEVANLRCTPLHYAARDDLVSAIPGRGVPVAEALLAGGADVNAQDSTAATPLDWAIRYNVKEITTILTARGGKRGAELPPVVIETCRTDLAPGQQDRLMALQELVLKRLGYHSVTPSSGPDTRRSATTTNQSLAE